MPEIDVTSKQLHVLRQACEVLSQVYIGNFGATADIPKLEEDDRRMLRDHLESLSPLVTGKCRGKFLSLTDKQVSEEARIAHELLILLGDVETS